MLTTQTVLPKLEVLLRDPTVHDWEKKALLTAQTSLKNQVNSKIVLERLEVELRPLALRNNLTANMADFYLQLTGDPAGQMEFNYDIHYQIDPPFQERAIFSGGCFWCLVEPFDHRTVVKAVISGYIGGTTPRPGYEQVSHDHTDYVEAVEIIYDSRFIKYQDILQTYWQLIDPTDASGQFDDRGNHYRPVIFYADQHQLQLAEADKYQLEQSNRYKAPIVVGIEAATKFWPAENYHQNFYQKFKTRYRRIERTRKQVLLFQHLRGNLRTFFKGSHK